jgi:hypothetical protein
VPNPWRELGRNTQHVPTITSLSLVHLKARQQEPVEVTHICQLPRTQKNEKSGKDRQKMSTQNVLTNFQKD